MQSSQRFVLYEDFTELICNSICRFECRCVGCSPINSYRFSGVPFLFAMILSNSPRDFVMMNKFEDLEIKFVMKNSNLIDDGINYLRLESLITK